MTGDAKNQKVEFEKPSIGFFNLSLKEGGPWAAQSWQVSVLMLGLFLFILRYVSDLFVHTNAHWLENSMRSRRPIPQLQVLRPN